MRKFCETISPFFSAVILANLADDKAARKDCLDFLHKQVGDEALRVQQAKAVTSTAGRFTIHPFSIPTGELSLIICYPAPLV